MPNTIPVAIAQPLAALGDIAENLRRMEAMIVDASKAGAALILFSECAVNGYDYNGIGAATSFAAGDAPANKLAELSRKHNIAIVAGFFEKGDKTNYNSALIVKPDGTRLVQRKHLTTAKEQKGSSLISGPRERIIFEVQGFKLAVLICADSGIQGIHEELSKAGCDAVLAPTAGLGEAHHGFSQSELTDAKRRAEYLNKAEQVCFPKDSIARALQLDLGLVACNQCGYDAARGFFHCGHAMVIDRTGDLSALIPGKFVFEHLRPALAIGTLTQRVR